MARTNTKNPSPLYADGSARADGSQDGSGFVLNLIENQFNSINPLLSLQTRGLWRGRWIFSVFKNKCYFRLASFYDLHKKGHSPPGTSKFAQAVSAWKTLSSDTKRSLDVRAAELNLHCSGFNFFIHLYMLDKPELLRYYSP